MHKYVQAVDILMKLICYVNIQMKSVSGGIDDSKIIIMIADMLLRRGYVLFRT
jgi:hypothetical protein